MKQRNILIAVICLLVVILAAIVAAAVLLPRSALPEVTEPTGQTAGETTSPSGETTAPEENSDPVETTVSTETTASTEAPTQPQEATYTLTFVGDCTLANRAGRTGKETFIGTVGDNYSYPFADVQTYFANDDCTFINLENALTDRGTAGNKTFVFRGPPAYTNILTQGSVEFANLANNHAMDYGKEGFEDTVNALKNAGIHYGGFDESVLFTTESGLTIGVYTAVEPKNMGVMQNALKALRKQGAEVVIGCFHWGGEYYYHPSANQKKMAHAAIEAGADIVYGHHPHVLQPIEYYGDGVIFYSLGNFSFGGNPDPGDKDTAILQQQIHRSADGKISLGELTIIPCHVTGTIYVGNDYQPVPMAPDHPGCSRVSQKLKGTWPIDRLETSYRDDLATEPTTEPTTEPITEPSTEPTAEPTTEPSTEPTAAPTTEPTAAPVQPTDPPAPAETTEPPQPPAAPEPDSGGGETTA